MQLELAEFSLTVKSFSMDFESWEIYSTMSSPSFAMINKPKQTQFVIAFGLKLYMASLWQVKLPITTNRTLSYGNRIGSIL